MQERWLNRSEHPLLLEEVLRSVPSTDLGSSTVCDSSTRGCDSTGCLGHLQSWVPTHHTIKSKCLFIYRENTKRTFSVARTQYMDEESGIPRDPGTYPNCWMVEVLPWNLDLRSLWRTFSTVLKWWAGLYLGENGIGQNFQFSSIVLLLL